MDITPVSKAFQAKMIEQFQGVNGVCIIQDDVLLMDLEITKTKP